jgi:hypothetical protein
MRAKRTTRRDRIARAQDSSGRNSSSPPGTPIEAILEAVDSLLRGQQRIALPRQGIDLMFDSEVVARCRTCNVSWTVKPSQFSSIGWWSCPGGCPRPDASHDDAASGGQAEG